MAKKQKSDKPVTKPKTDKKAGAKAPAAPPPKPKPKAPEPKSPGVLVGVEVVPETKAAPPEVASPEPSQPTFQEYPKSVKSKDGHDWTVHTKEEEAVVVSGKRAE